MTKHKDPNKIDEGGNEVDKYAKQKTISHYLRQESSTLVRQMRPSFRTEHGESFCLRFALARG